MLTDIVNARPPVTPPQQTLRLAEMPLVPDAPGIPQLAMGDGGDVDYEEEQAPDGEISDEEASLRFQGYARFLLACDLAEAWSALVRPHRWLHRFLVGLLEEVQQAEAARAPAIAPRPRLGPCRSSSTTLGSTRSVLRAWTSAGKHELRARWGRRPTRSSMSRPRILAQAGEERSRARGER
ncbi:MAG: hypothetical protein HY319_24255 [Armatimonadetes bacterium]|nr:hypothetical protein [Armatimonadota bacterium]